MHLEQLSLFNKVIPRRHCIFCLHVHMLAYYKLHNIQLSNIWSKLVRVWNTTILFYLKHVQNIITFLPFCTTSFSDLLIIFLLKRKVIGSMFIFLHVNMPVYSKINNVQMAKFVFKICVSIKIHVFILYETCHTLKAMK